MAISLQLSNPNTKPYRLSLGLVNYTFVCQYPESGICSLFSNRMPHFRALTYRDTTPRWAMTYQLLHRNQFIMP
jgi:hypothetical protein